MSRVTTGPCIEQSLQQDNGDRGDVRGLSAPHPDPHGPHMASSWASSQHVCRVELSRHSGWIKVLKSPYHGLCKCVGGTVAREAPCTGGGLTWQGPTGDICPHRQSTQGHCKVQRMTSGQGQGSPGRTITTRALEWMGYWVRECPPTWGMGGAQASLSLLWVPGGASFQPPGPSHRMDCSQSLPTKIFTKHAADKGLRSGIYEELSRLHN